MASLGIQHLGIHSADDIHEIFKLLGYQVESPYPFEGAGLDAFDFEKPDHGVRRAYVVGEHDNHTIYLFEVNDLRQTQLRDLAWDVLRRQGTALLTVTRDYREVIFADPRFAGKALKSNVRVNKLKVMTSDPTRHDLDTLNAIHAHNRTGREIYEAQAKAFNVEAITKRFYEEYRRHYELAKTAIKQYNRAIPEFQNEDQAHKLHAFTQRLLGRLMFIYFLQRKGWMGGKQHFLTDQYTQLLKRHVDSQAETFYYYQEVLKPLFFETMNTQRIGNATRWPGILIPYLNGGLFDPARDPQAEIILPDSLFDPYSNDGLLAFFNRYNFTIAEDTPMEQDVAVDPEMLGKVFENMLEERDRGQSGSFYTPRTIVSYMCQEALAGYLEESAGIARDRTCALFDPDTPADLTPAEAAQIQTALRTLTVLDPAVGSGSFLVGMMNEILRLEKACLSALDHEGSEGASLTAAWKERIIRDTLYGVDIKPEAIEIAQLRLWLALVVDQTLDQARPLPNLDYKLMAGNSLIETIDGEPVLGASAETMLQGDFSGAGSPIIPIQMTLGMFPTQQALTTARQKLDALRREFFNAPPQERADLRRRITSQERQIVYASLKEKADKLAEVIDGYTKKAADHAAHGAKLPARDEKKLNEAAARLAHLQTLEQELANPDKPLPFFLYKMHFSEVFQRKGGFDIVIANPPYVRQELISDQKPELKVSYPDVYAGTADLYVYFFGRGFNLLRTGGQLAYITPNKFMRANYGKNLRKFLAEKICLHILIDFGDTPIFDATTYPLILLASKHTPNGSQFKSLDIRTLDQIDRLFELGASASPTPQTELKEDGWQLGDSATRALMTKLRSAGRPLGDYVDGKIYYGIKTGFNEAFVIDETTRQALIEADPNSADIIKPFLRGRDVKRWRGNWANLYLIAVHRDVEIENYPAILNHLAHFRPSLEKRAGTQKWYEFQHSGVELVQIVQQPKIIYPDISQKPQFALDTEGTYCTNTAYVMPTSDLFLLSVLNSNVINLFYSQISAQVRGSYLRFFTQYVEKIPIPDAPSELREKIASLAQACLDHAHHPEKLAALESELNQYVYQAYGLTDAEIALIEGQLSGQGFTTENE